MDGPATHESDVMLFLIFTALLKGIGNIFPPCSAYSHWFVWKLVSATE